MSVLVINDLSKQCCTVFVITTDRLMINCLYCVLNVLLFYILSGLIWDFLRGKQINKLLNYYFVDCMHEGRVLGFLTKIYD